MIRKFTLLLLACMGVFSLSKAQKCGTDKIDQHLLQTMPGYAAELASFNQKLYNQSLVQQLLVNPSPTDSVYEIPVVVHLMSDHASGSVGAKTAGQLNDAFIGNVISYINQAFAATWPSYPSETTGGVNIRYKFVLAKRDPNCNPTTGIVRVNATSLSTYVADGIRGSGSTDPGEDDDVVKALSIWPRDRYYNIWVVNKIEDWDGVSGGGTAGFAYVPPGNPANLDGAVILAPFFNTNDVTTVHEIGHSFGLHHPFRHTASGCAPNNPATCLTNGDFVCDTEPVLQPSGGCPMPPTVNTCTGAPFSPTISHNFMNYTNCQDRFTLGQRQRSMAIFYQYRASLISSLGATPFPTTTMQSMCPISGPSVPPSPASNYGPRDIILRRFGADTVFRNNSGSYTLDGNQYYIDNICEQRAELKTGQQYSGFIGLSNSTHAVRVYIDYNNDGDMGDANELIYASAIPGVTNSVTFNFTPPLTAVSCIPIRMRVMADINGSITSECSAMQRGQVEDYEVIIRGGSTSGTVTGLVDLFINPNDGNPSCFGVTARVESTINSGITPVWYKWFKTNGGVVTAGPSSANPADTTWGANNWSDLDSVYLKVAYVGLCGIDTALSDTQIVNRVITVMPSMKIGVIAGTNPTCIDETVTLGKISSINDGGATNPRWYMVGSATPVSTATTLNVLGGPNGARYYYEVNLPPSTCNGNTPLLRSDTVQINHTQKTPTAQVDLTVGTNPGCPGQVLTYTASGTILGSNPTYNWFVNGNPAGTNASTFSSTFNNGDVVSVTISNLSPCSSLPTISDAAPAIQHELDTADITIVQVSGGNPACSGHPVVFSATPVNSGPPAPQFQWLINNAPVIGANSPVFNTTALVNGDVVKCVLISTDPCVTNTLDTSAGIQMSVTPSKVPKISFTLTKGNNPGCLDSLVEFTATVTDAGTNPQIEWLVNGFPLNLNNPVYSTTNLLNNDVVIARVVPTDGDCYLPDTGFSVPVTMVRSPTPNPPIISLIHNMLETDINGSFVWFGPGGQLTGGEDGKYHPGELGQYYAVTNNNGCWSKPSNILTITLLDINDVAMLPASIYPNPTTGKLTVDWSRNVNMTVGIYSTVGQKLMEEKASNVSSKAIDLSSLASGMYFVVITDEDGRSSTTRITLQR